MFTSRLAARLCRGDAKRNSDFKKTAIVTLQKYDFMKNTKGRDWPSCIRAVFNGESLFLLLAKQLL